MTANHPSSKAIAPISFLDLWRVSWSWMKSYGVPLLPYQEEQIAKLPPVAADKYTPQQMAYQLTEHYENPSMKEKPSLELQLIIDAYKYQQMEILGWPSWGYRGVTK